MTMKQHLLHLPHVSCVTPKPSRFVKSPTPTSHCFTSIGKSGRFLGNIGAEEGAELGNARGGEEAIGGKAEMRGDNREGYPGA